MNTVFLAPEVKPKTIYSNAGVTVFTEVILHEDKQNYRLVLSDNQALSISTDLLSTKANEYKIEFNLKVIATGHYVINFADCNIEQMEFYNGESLLQFSKQPYESKWNISIINYDGIAPSFWYGNWKDRKEVCPYYQVSNVVNNAYPLFRKYATMDALNTDNTRFSLESPVVDYYSYSLNPFILTKISLHLYTATTYTSPPSKMQIYGSNDMKNWTLIYSNTNLDLTSHYGEVLYFAPTIIRPFKCFKFHFESNGPATVLAPMSMEGIQSNLLSVGEIIDFPGITAAIGGYDVTLNTDEGCSMNQSYTPYGATPNVSNPGLDISRTSSDIPFKLTFTYPEAVRPCGFFMQEFTSNKNDTPRWFAWYGSDDLETWEKAVELREVLPFNTSAQWMFYNYPCDFGSSHKYWQLRIYTLFSGGNRLQALYQAYPLTKSPQYSDFDTIVPKMTSNSQDGYVVSASSASSGSAYNMYDMDDNTYCEGSISGTWNTSIDMGDTVVIKGLRLVAPTAEYNRMPTDFKIQGSTDNSTWDDIKTVTLGNSYWSAGLIYSCDFNNSTAYRYYRLLVSATYQGSYVRISELGWTTELIGNPIDYYTEELLVPLMSSNSQDGYVASASSVWGSTAEPCKAFNYAVSGRYDNWQSNNKTNGNAECTDTWVQIQMPSAKVCNYITLSPREDYSDCKPRTPKAFTIEGSNNGSSWTVLLSVADGGQYSNPQSWIISNTTAYSYYRMNITKTYEANQYISIGELTLANRTYYNNNE